MYRRLMIYLSNTDRGEVGYVTSETNMTKDIVKNLGEYAITGGPGRPKGGRTQAIETLDRMLAREGNQEKLEECLQKEFDDNPPRFLLRFVYPLAPKNVNIEAGGLAIIVKPPVRGDEESHI